MGRLIDADAIIRSKELTKKIVVHNMTPYLKVDDLLDFIDSLPTANDVEKVVERKNMNNNKAIEVINNECEKTLILATCSNEFAEALVVAIQALGTVGEIKVKLDNYENFNTLRPINEWHEDYGTCLFWRLPINEPPYCGSPLDSTWEEHDYDNYFTHFTRLMNPIDKELN